MSYLITFLSLRFNEVNILMSSNEHSHPLSQYISISSKRYNTALRFYVNIQYQDSLCRIIILESLIIKLEIQSGIHPKKYGCDKTAGDVLKLPDHSLSLGLFIS